jgi:hypothetical protein
MYRKTVLAVSCILIVAVAVLFWPHERSRRWEVGEKLEYRVEGRENGKFETRVIEKTNWNGRECYRLGFSLSFENRGRQGMLIMDRDGLLMYCEVKDQGITGAVDVWPILGRVRCWWMTDNQIENLIELPLAPKLSTPEHFLFLLRFLKLEGYYDEFNFVPLPVMTGLVPARVSTIGEAEVEVPLGRFECWVLRITGWNARVWVSKRDGTPIRFEEDGLTYLLTNRILK